MVIDLYLQKRIISFLMNEINRFNKTMPNYSESQDNKNKNIQEFSNLLQSLSLVNWNWFNSVSSYLNSLVNFNHSVSINNTLDQFKSTLKNGISITSTTTTITTASNRKFKLGNNENIKYLRIDLVDFEFSEKSSEEKDQLLNLINNSTSTSFKNLKKLIVSNSTDPEEIYFINKLSFNYIIISFLHFNQESEGITGDINEPLLSTNIKEIIDIEGKDIPVQRAVSILKPLKKVESLILDRFNVASYKQLYIQLYLDGNESLLDNNGGISSSSCCLSYVENLTIDDFQIQTIESLYYVLKLVPRVKHLSFQICFDNLVKQLDSTGKCKGCICSREDPCNQQFDYYWNGINQMIQNHKHLTTLSIGQHCFYPIAYSTPFKLDDEFVLKFGTMIANNKSIKYLKTSKLPSNIINLIEFISNINQTIIYHKHFFLNMSGPFPNQYLLDYQSLIERFSHIKMFLIDDALTNSEVLTYINK